jgi:hypothetical protein
MANFTATVKILVKCNFLANNPDHARTIASNEIWGLFDQVEIDSHGDVELTEIDTVMSIEDCEEDGS